MPKTKSDFQHDACVIANLARGADVLSFVSDGDQNDPQVKDAGEALPVLIEQIRIRADQLVCDLDQMGKTA